MPDFGLSCSITRTLLGLPDLDLNDHEDYYIGGESFGRQVSWNRQQVTSPFLDGAVTTYRNRQMVNSQVAIETMGQSLADLQAKLGVLKQAFSQDSFTLNLAVGSFDIAYLCEASDYNEVWSSARLAARQVSIVFTVPNQPVPLLGGAY